jgi:hypothetical protein
VSEKFLRELFKSEVGVTGTTVGKAKRRRRALNHRFRSLLWRRLVLVQRTKQTVTELPSRVADLYKCDTGGSFVQFALGRCRCGKVGNGEGGEKERVTVRGRGRSLHCWCCCGGEASDAG